MCSVCYTELTAELFLLNLQLENPAYFLIYFIYSICSHTSCGKSSIRLQTYISVCNPLLAAPVLARVWVFGSLYISSHTPLMFLCHRSMIWGWTTTNWRWCCSPPCTASQTSRTSTWPRTRSVTSRTEPSPDKPTSRWETIHCLLGREVYDTIQLYVQENISNVNGFSKFPGFSWISQDFYKDFNRLCLNFTMF